MRNIGKRNEEHPIIMAGGKGPHTQITKVLHKILRSTVLGMVVIV